MCKFKVHWYWYHIDFVLTCFWFSCWIQIIWCSRLCNRVSWISTANKSCQISADRPLVLDKCATLRRPPHGNPSWGEKAVSRSLWLSQVCPPICGNNAGGRRPSLNREPTAACLHLRISFLPFFSLLVRDVFLRIVLAVGDVNSHLKEEVEGEREWIPNVLPVCPQDRPIRKRGQSQCHIHQ